MPLGEIDGDRTDQYLPLSIVRARLMDRWTLRDVPYRTGGPARYVEIAETGGRLGFITPMTHNFCESYRVRLTCTGTLYMCLGQEDAADLRALANGRRRGRLTGYRAGDRAQAQGARLRDRPADPTPRCRPPYERDRRLSASCPTLGFRSSCSRCRSLAASLSALPAGFWQALGGGPFPRSRSFCRSSVTRPVDPASSHASVASKHQFASCWKVSSVRGLIVYDRSLR